MTPRLPSANGEFGHSIRANVTFVRNDTPGRIVANGRFGHSIRTNVTFARKSMGGVA